MYTNIYFVLPQLWAWIIWKIDKHASKSTSKNIFITLEMKWIWQEIKKYFHNNPFSALKKVMGNNSEIEQYTAKAGDC